MGVDVVDTMLGRGGGDKSRARTVNCWARLRLLSVGDSKRVQVIRMVLDGTRGVNFATHSGFL